MTTKRTGPALKWTARLTGDGIKAFRVRQHEGVWFINHKASAWRALDEFDPKTELHLTRKAALEWARAASFEARARNSHRMFMEAVKAGKAKR